MTRPAWRRSMTARRAFAPAILFAVFFSFPRRPSASRPASAAFHRSDYERPLSDLELLGKRIFEDANLSEPKGVACESCHGRKRAYQGDNRSPIPGVAVGSRPGEFGNRKAADDHVHGLQPGLRLLQGRRRRRAEARAARRPVLGRPRRRPRRSAVFPADEPDRDEQSLRRRGRRESQGGELCADDDGGFRAGGVRRPESGLPARCAVAVRLRVARDCWRPSPPSSTTACAARSRSLRWRRAAWRCSSIPSAAIASPAMPASRS